MAASTGDGCTLPEEQAAPDDTATPARSKAITAVSARRPGWLKAVVFGNRSACLAENDDVWRGRAQPGLQPLAQPQGMRGLVGQTGR